MILELQNIDLQPDAEDFRKSYFGVVVEVLLIPTLKDY